MGLACGPVRTVASAKSQFTSGSAQLRKAVPSAQGKASFAAVPIRRVDVQAIHRLGDTSGLSQNQIEFMKRKHGLLPPEPAPEIMPPPEPVSVGQAQLSDEQKAFVLRKEAIARGEDPWADEQPDAPNVPSQPTSAPSPSPTSSEFSAEQLEFLQRRSTEGRGAYGFSTEGAGPVSPAAAPRPVESTSTSPAHSPVREVEEPVPVDVSANPDAPVAGPGASTEEAVGVDTTAYTPEQLAFYKKQLVILGVASAPAVTAQAADYSPEQLEFLARRAAESKAFA
ncbi:hypothetical protein CYMTET_54507 [Cymbomonas tetramitiformis]|uniref:Uncharacterized protein n=1 Tax=Cymbomonas tetramitiformis TaxID=36881 RepID=A0AAE0BF26_9CHLO|nr:hypothetical protein CYMTET_54507 [Cymbomonas tetramitiformis]